MFYNNTECNHNIEAEKAILGAILIDTSIIKTVSAMVSKDDFYFDTNKLIFEKMLDMKYRNEPIDIITLNNRIKEDQVFDVHGYCKSNGEMRYLTEIATIVSTTQAVKYHCEIVKKHSIQRQIVNSAKEIIDMANQGTFENSIDLLNSAKQRLDIKIQQDQPKDFSITSIMANVAQQIEKEYQETESSKLYTEFRDLDKYTAGLHPQEVTILAARPGIGKAQPLYSKILTPYGWERMGDIIVGSKVMGSNGKPCNVVGVFPQGEKEIYRVYFSDNTFTDCTLDHLWETKTRKERKGKANPTIKTTKQILETLRTNKDQRLNHSIRYVEPVQFEKKELFIDPYVLGLLIGDGGFTKGASIGFSNIEKDIFEKMNNLLPETDKLTMNSNGKDHWVTRKRYNGSPTKTKNALFSLGLFGLKSSQKFIPDVYLYSCVEDRLKLLRGLIDTDGTIVKEDTGKYKNNYIEYSTTSERLSKNIRELVLSLGGRCAITTRFGNYKKDGVNINTIPNYRVFIRFPNNIIPVSSEKHLSKYSGESKLTEKFIKDIVYVGEYEAQCIMVDSDDHLYVTDDYILTHNTAFAVQLMINLAVKKNKVLFVSREMSTVQLGKRILSNIGKINGHKLRFCKSLSDKDFVDIGKAMEVINHMPIEINDKLSTIQEIRLYCRDLKDQGKLDVLIVDYLGLLKTLKKTNGQREAIEDISRQLKEISLDLEIPVICLAQLNRENEREKREPKLIDLRESGSIEQDADNVLFLHVPSDTDQTQDCFDVKVIVAKQRNGPCGYVWLKYYRNTFRFYNAGG